MPRLRQLKKQYNHTAACTDKTTNEFYHDTLEQAKMRYQMYKDNQNDSDYEKITMYDLICYMDNGKKSKLCKALDFQKTDDYQR